VACRKRYVVEPGKPRRAPAVETAVVWNTVYMKMINIHPYSSTFFINQLGS